MSELTIVQSSKWEPEARIESAPRTEPEARTEPTLRIETAARTELVNNKIQSTQCPSCGYLLVYSKELKSKSIRCKKSGNVFQVE